jgi:hypothetical protein
MGASVQPEKVYSPDNPFAGGKQYSPDNPFAGGPKAPPMAQSDVTATTGPHTQPLEGQMGHPITDASPAPLPERIADLVTQAPGVGRAVAGYRGLLSLMGVGHETPAEAMTQQKANVASFPAKVRIPTALAASAPFASVVAPLGPFWGGAAFGAAAGADRPAESFGERVKNTGEGAVIGGVTSKLGVAAAEGAGNVATRMGITDKAARVMEALPGGKNIASTMGTRGQVNQAFSDRQDILDAVAGPNASGARQQIDRIAARNAEAAKLYGIARQDKQAIQNPELNQLLSDPQIQQAYKIASQIRAVSDNPLQKTAVPDQVPLALQKMGVSPERYAELQAVGQSRRVPMSGTDILPPELMGPQATGVDVPDPQVLASLKRYLGNAAKGNLKSTFPVKQEEAIALLPKLGRIRDILHEVSPPWKAADAAYADAKGQEEAFAHGYDAVKHANSTVGAKLPTHSPEAMLQSIEEPRYPNEPPAAMSRRAEAFRNGVKASVANNVQSTPVDRGAVSALGTKALAATEKAAQIRSIMMGSAPEANSLESILAAKRGTLMSGRPEGQPASGLGYEVRRARWITKPFTQHDLVATPEGQQTVAQRLRSPQFQAAEIARFRGGREAGSYLKNLLGTSLGGQAAR